jgi:hypothetical protein
VRCCRGWCWNCRRSGLANLPPWDCAARSRSATPPGPIWRRWGRVLMPYALARKDPNASREWAWQWVFPQQNRWRDRESGAQGRHHHDLHACAQPWSAWGTKPSRHSVTRRTVGSRTREPRLI